MKNATYLVLFVFLFSGCTAVRDFVYDPVVEFDESTGLVSTNGWAIKPGFSKSVDLISTVAPVPWAGLAGQGILGGLAVVGALYGRKYKQAGRSLVETVDVYRQGVRDLQGGEDFDKGAVREMAAKHSSDGVSSAVSGLVKTYTGKTT
jgi:hypothetical protein